MPPIVLTAVQAAFLLLLYLFVARAVRAVVRDLRSPGPAAAQPAAPRKATSRSRDEAGNAPGELVVHVPDERPRVIALDAHDVTFGRADVSTVVLDDPYVSDHHAKVYFDGDAWRVDDLGSTNGTYLNQAKVSSPTPLSSGDQLGIGKTVVQVRRGSGS